ncbi:MAG: hypothetical protein R3F14_16150 [Polyangiaceae bacterium]
MAAFAARHAKDYVFRDRELAGAFEIGCFLSLIADYDRQKATVTLHNLDANEFRYLTTPNGNPRNFSFVEVRTITGGFWQLRQQVRVRSHLHKDITFTPDIVLLDGAATINENKDIDYANGNRAFFSVSADAVVAAHECKSMTGFPELYVSFLGMFLAAHKWAGARVGTSAIQGDVGHLAPTLFVGGEASNLHRKIIAALQEVYPINIVTSLHRGGWVLIKRAKLLRRLPFGVATHSASVTTVRAPPRRLVRPSSTKTQPKIKDADIPF